MADKTLKITLDLDNSRAAAQARAFRADQQKLAADLAGDATKLEAAKVAAARDAQGRLVATSRTATDAIRADFKAQEEAATGAFGRMASGVGSFAAQMVGLDSARAVVSAIVGEFEEAKNSAYAASKMVSDYRESLLELAALKGRMGGTGEAVKQEIAFRSQTLQTEAASREFQSAALGVGESAIGNQISRDEWQKAMVMAGKFQAVEGGAAAAHGELIGLIPSLSGKQVTGAEAFAKEQQLYKIFQPGGFSFSAGIDQYKQLAPLIQSGVYKDTEAAALLSAFSTTNREGAGENVQQFTRATLGGIGRKGVPRIEGAEPIGQYYQSLGITSDLIKQTEATRLPFEIADRVSADIAAAAGAAKGRGEEFNAYTYLKQKGYGNQEDVNVLMQYAGLKQSGALDKKFMPLAADAALPSIADAMGPIDAAQAADPAMMGRKAALAEQASNIAVGAGKEEYLASLKRTAFARRRARGEETIGSYDEVQAMSWFNPREVLFQHKFQTDIEAQRMLVDEARARGVELPEAISGSLGRGHLTQAGRNVDLYGGDEALYELASRVRAAGGDVLPGTMEVTAAATRQLDEAGRFERGEQPGGPQSQVGILQQILNVLKGQAEKPKQAPPPREIMKAPVAESR